MSLFKKNKLIEQSIMKSHDKSERATLHGISNKGSVMIKKGTAKLFGRGLLYALQPSQITDGTQRYKKVLEHTTPGYIRKEEVEKSIRCFCCKTGNLYRFIGEIHTSKKVLPDSVTSLSKAVPKETVQQLGRQNIRNLDKRSDGDSGSTEKKRPSQQILISNPKPAEGQIHEPSLLGECHSHLMADLNAIGIARKAGLDPNLKLVHVCALVCESRASIYRKIKLGVFPSPIKRGKSSFWILSEIERYISGNTQATRVNYAV